MKICAFIHCRTKIFPSCTANPNKIIMPLCKEREIDDKQKDKPNNKKKEEACPPPLSHPCEF